MNESMNQYDGWLKNESEVAALTMRQRLVPIEGEDAVFFPPTYPIPENQNKAGYDIKKFDDGSSVCQIDSVGSQANRMEPLFKREKYKHLVPQVIITASDRTVHLFDAGHRAADAIVRFSTIGPKIHEAFMAYKQGNAVPLASFVPTSIIFGAWDSRATQAKLPRLVRSVIRAYNVRELTRSAQYATIAGEIMGDGEAQAVAPGGKETKESQLGLAHVPAVKTHGGVQLQGETGQIRREAILNLSALRTVAGKTDDETLKIRRYLLGLALVSFTAPMETNLREGCELVPDPERPATWEMVKHDGTRKDFTIKHEDALSFATATAEAFGVTGDECTGAFDPDLARMVMNLSDKDRKKIFRQGVTREAIEQLGKKGSKAKGSSIKS